MKQTFFVYYYYYYYFPLAGLKTYKRLYLKEVQNVQLTKDDVYQKDQVTVHQNTDTLYQKYNRKM